MKRIIVILLCIVIGLSLAISVSATGSNDDLSLLLDDIISLANDLYGENISRCVTEKDVNLELAKMIYVDTNILEIDSTSYEDIAVALNSGRYIYEVPIYVDGSTIIANIQQGLPLNPDADFTDEEKKEVLDNEGKWFVSAMMFCEGEIIDYDEQISASVKDDSNVLLVGSLPYFKTAVAIVSDEQGEITTLIPLATPFGEETTVNYLTRSKVYDYAEIREYVNNLQFDNTDLNSGYSQTRNYNFMHRIGIIGALISVIGLSTTFYYIRYRKEHTK